MTTYVTRSRLPPLEEYVDELKHIWQSHFLTNEALYVRKLEEELLSLLKVGYLQLVSNGTVALQLALEALDISGEVITTPFSYVATSNSIVWQHCEPVFADIEPVTLTLDVSLLERCITPRTRAILPVHVFGMPCNVEVIDKIAKEHGLKVIYDAAHAFGCEYKGRSLLDYGDISTVSFHATKVFNTAEGGAVICKDAGLNHKLNLLKRFGHYIDDYRCVGINAKMSELHAALGMVNLRYFYEEVEERKLICSLYDGALSTHVRRLKYPEHYKGNYGYYPVILNDEHQLTEVLNRLAEKDIYPRRYFYPSLNTLRFYRYQPCPVSESVSKRILCLPLYGGLEPRTVDQICDIINTVV